MWIMTTIFVIIITITFILSLALELRAGEVSGTVSHPKLQTLSNRTPNQY